MDVIIQMVYLSGYSLRQRLPINNIERYNCRGARIVVWAKISVGGYTNLHVLHQKALTALEYWVQIFHLFMKPFGGSIG